jgi:hypothetical protein
MRRHRLTIEEGLRQDVDDKDNEIRRLRARVQELTCECGHDALKHWAPGCECVVEGCECPRWSKP